MGKILNYIKNHKKLIVFVLIIIFFAIKLITSDRNNKTDSVLIPIQPEQKQPAYKSIIPGINSEEDLNKNLGAPLNKKTEDNITHYNYKSTNEYRNTEAITEENKVIFIKEVVNYIDNKKSKEIIDLYGEPSYRLYDKESPNSAFGLYVYPNNGLAFIGHNDGTVFEIWYFEPTTIDVFLTKWAYDYSVLQPDFQQD